MNWEPRKAILYNDDIDISNDIDIKIDKEDKSFNSNITKSGSEQGIYTIIIYSEKKDIILWMFF